MALSHWIYAGLGALAVWPLKHVWETWIEKFWKAFWISFKAGFKTTPEGKQFFDSYHQARAKKDAEILKSHPELKDLLTCSTCHGIGRLGVLICEECGGTGLV